VTEPAEQPAKPVRTWRPIAAWSTAILLLVIAAGIWRHVLYAPAEKSSRLCTLMVLQGELLVYAKEHGSYPSRFEEVRIETGSGVGIDESFLRRLDPHSIVYCAAGMPVGGAGDNRRLFYERAAKRYGSETGWFEIFEYSWKFHHDEPAKPVPGTVAGSEPEKKTEKGEEPKP
jgi:hypothetical protein